MAILKSVDGRFYDVPDSQLDRLLIPAEQVKERLGAAGALTGGGGHSGGSRSGPVSHVFIQVFGGAPPRRVEASTATPAGEQEEGVRAYHHSVGYCGLRCFSYCGSYCGNYCGHYCA
jgi:hypothetical protein